MPKLTETYVKRLSQTNSGTDKYWDAEIKGLVLYVGKKAKSWYFQKDVGGRTKKSIDRTLSYNCSTGRTADRNRACT